MSSIMTHSRRRSRRPLPLLHNGDRLTQVEFHRRYEACADVARFELVEGLVVMASPVGQPHAKYHARLVHLLGDYETSVEGIEMSDNGTVILSDASEVQPDATLRLKEEFGGQSRVSKSEYIVGAPEWIGEIAHSSVSIDLHGKKAAYQRAGVHEYFVLCVEEQELHWFNFKSRRQIASDSHGIMRSRVFPGLWIDAPALLARDGKRLIKTLDAGLASRERAEFVRRLQAVRRGR